jgi:hypothetical protein
MVRQAPSASTSLRIPNSASVAAADELAMVPQTFDKCSQTRPACPQMTGRVLIACVEGDERSQKRELRVEVSGSIRAPILVLASST